MLYIDTGFMKEHYLSHTFIMWWSSSKLGSKFERAISGGNGGIWSLNSKPLHVRIINRRDASLKLIYYSPKFPRQSECCCIYINGHSIFRGINVVHHWIHIILSPSQNCIPLYRPFRSILILIFMLIVVIIHVFVPLTSSSPIPFPSKSNWKCSRRIIAFSVTNKSIHVVISENNRKQKRMNGRQKKEHGWNIHSAYL